MDSKHWDDVKCKKYGFPCRVYTLFALNGGHLGFIMQVTRPLGTSQQSRFIICMVLYHSSFLLHFICHNHDRNAIVTYLTGIVCNCHIVADGFELKYTICAKQNGGCNNIYLQLNTGIAHLLYCILHEVY